MKPQLATGLHSVSTAYGDILYRAYRELSDQTSSFPHQLHSLEEHLQDLGYTAIHALNRKYFNNLKNCLNIFHQNKNVKGIDGLLLKIYGPFIWRSLKSSNPIVRTQSSIIFLTIFPLYNSSDSMNQIELDKILQKQFNLIMVLLKDQDHRVRAASCRGVCHILKEFWEVIPSQSTHQILSYLVGTLGFDSSDAQIRANVLTGLQELLRNPLTHVALRGLLPILTNLLHDFSDKVRLAFVQLLNKVKVIRGFKFYDIVTVDRICDQLNRDAKKPALCSEMTQLLLNSFYPRAEYQDEEENTAVIDYSREQIKRCLSFVHTYESAALVFYANLYKHTSVGSAIKVCVMLWNVLISQNSSADAENQNDDSMEDNENLNKSNRNKKNLKNKNDSLSRMKRGREELKKNTKKSSFLAFKPELAYEILIVMEAILKPLQKKLTEPSFQPSRALLEEHLPASIQAVYDRLKDLKLLCDAEKKIEESVTCHIAISSLLEISGVLGSMSISHKQLEEGQKNKKKGTKQLSVPTLPSEDVLSSYYEEEEGECTDESFRLAILNSVITQSDPLKIFDSPLWKIVERDFDDFEKFLKGSENFQINHFEKTLHLVYSFLDSSSSQILVEYRRQVLNCQPMYLDIQGMFQRCLDAYFTESMSGKCSNLHVVIAFMGYLWMLLSIQKDFINQSPSQSPQVDTVFRWVSKFILSSLDESGKDLIFSSILSLASDLLTLEENMYSEYVLNTINQWAIKILDTHFKGPSPLKSSLPSITRLLSVLSSPSLKVNIPSEDHLYSIQSTIQSTWCNWMDVLLRHLSLAHVQSMIISYLKFKDSKIPSRFQTLLLNRIVSFIAETVMIPTDFEWKSLLDSKSDLTEEKLSEGIQWKDSRISGSICAEIITQVASSSPSFDMILPTLLHHFVSIKHESSRVGFGIILRKLFKSSNVNELPSLIHDQLTNSRDHEMMMELLQI